MCLQVYQDGIMGVAAVLAGLRSTLKSGTEAYQKQRDLMNNNEMMLSVSYLCACMCSLNLSPSLLHPSLFSLPPSFPPSVFVEFEDGATKEYC